jgi:thioredoxin
MPVELTLDNYSDFVNETTNTVIDFSATWCGPCKKMEPFFKTAEDFMKGTNTNIVFAKVDVNQQESIATDYEIQCMPTTVLLKNGKVVARFEGFMDTTKILLFIGKYFDVKEKDSENKTIDDSNQNSEVNSQ